MRTRTVLSLGSLATLAAGGARLGDDVGDAYPAQLAAAEKSLRLGETRELRRWLDACDPALRGWEWSHLQAIADNSRRHLDLAYPAIRVEMSPSGDRLALVEGAAVRVLAWPSCEELRVIEGHADSVYRARFSPDGERLLTVARDATSRSWDLGTGAEIARIELENPAIGAVAFSPDGATAATCAWERDEGGQVHGLVWLWNPASGEVEHRERVGIKPLSAIAFLPDGSGTVTGSWDGLVHLLDVRAREVARFVLPDEGVYNAVDDVAVSPAGAFVAAASKDRTTRVFALGTGELVATLRGHGGYVQGVSFSPDGAALASASIDTTVVLWETSDWSRRTTLRGPSESVRGAVWADDGGSVVACALDPGLWVWDARADDAATTVIETGFDGIYSSTISPDGEDVAVACFDGRMRIFDSRTGELRREWMAHSGSSCHAAAYSSDGRRLVSASWDGTAGVWDPSDGSLVASLDAGEGVTAAAISADGSRAATSGATLQLWDVDGPRRLQRIAIEGARPARLDFSPDGALLAAAWSDGVARVYRVESRELVVESRGSSAGAGTVAFSEDGARVFVGDDGGVVRAFEVEGGRLVFETDTGARAINRVACSGDRLAVATDQLWLLDAEQGVVVLGTAPHDDTLWDVGWSPDGERLATCAIGGRVSVLETTSRRGERAPAGGGPPADPLCYAAVVDGNGDIWLSAGGEARRLTTHPGMDNWPVPSPDGRWIAFQSQRDESYDVFVVPADGSGPPRKLASDASHDGLPVWSPDGSELAFFSSRGFIDPEPRTLPGHVYVVRADGTELRRVTAEPLGSTVGPSSWSPDGTALLLGRRVGDAGLDIHRLDLETLTEHRLTHSPENEYGARFSPDGERIAFYLESEERCDVAVCNADGTGRRVLSPEPGWHYVQDWSSDGAWVLFLSFEPDGSSPRVRAVRVADGRTVAIETEHEVREIRWAPAVR